jgi:hypothetical protein
MSEAYSHYSLNFSQTFSQGVKPGERMPAPDGLMTFPDLGYMVLSVPYIFEMCTEMDTTLESRFDSIHYSTVGVDFSRTLSYSFFPPGYRVS